MLTGIVLVLATVVGVDRYQAWRPAANVDTAEPSAVGSTLGEAALVKRITDGDTFVTADNAKVRLIGVDAPESTSLRYGYVECLGAEASAHLARLIPPGTDIRLVFDVERRDRYGRTLAYVYRAVDGLFVNRAIVADGFAQPASYPPNIAHAGDFVDASRDARRARRGLWSNRCKGDAPETTYGTQSVDESHGRDCDRAYPDVCIPPSPPDLDCADLVERRFRVLAPDPHHLDSDGNGLGCEL